METLITNKPPERKNGLIILVTLVLVFLIFYAVMTILAPAKMMKSVREMYGFKQNEKSIINDTILTDSTYLSLFREKAFYQARTAMAESDSIYLTINLKDSLLSLEISGVSVSKSTFSKLSVSKMFRDRYGYALSSMLSRPLTVINNVASIPKEPLMIKMAPKDTSEFKPDIIPDTADYEPVNYIMEMDNGIVIHVYQEEKLNPGDGRQLFFFTLRYRLHETWRTLKSVITFKVPEYHPFIKVRLPRSHAKIIYRALPEQGQIAVYR